MKSIVFIILWLIPMLWCVHGYLECDRFKYVYVTKQFQITSKNYPRFYPYFFKCGFYFQSPPGTSLRIDCQDFWVYGGGRGCRVGGVRTHEYRTGKECKYCGHYKNLRMNFDGSRKDSTTVYFSMFSTSVSWKGFRCDVRAVPLPSLSPPLTKTTTTKKYITTRKENNFTCKCGVKNTGGRIVGGVYTADNEYPWMAGLLSGHSTDPYCGGALVTDKHIVTAAHCVLSQMSVVLGEHDTQNSNDDAKYFKVIKVDVHPDYNWLPKNDDIAVLTLNHSVTFSKKIQPICLPSNDDSFVNKLCTITGWGATSDQDGSDILRKAKVKVIPNFECKKSYGNIITNDMLCAGFPKGGTDSCQGDSGGPLACPQNERLLLAGVTSFGHGCGRPGYPGVYARVPSLVDWVRSKIRDGRTCN